MPRASRDRAEHLVRRTAARATRPRIEVLSVLLGAPRALAHREVEQGVKQAFAVDRVTIYRVLEWLVARGLAHRISGDDRVWRFKSADEGHARQHAHFSCCDCGEVICLGAAVAARDVRVPSGYRPQEVELTVKGLCADCAPSPRAGRRARSRAAHPH